MTATLHELLDVLLRWVHLIAGIMWVGNSMLFNWLDRNLVMPDRPKSKLLEGVIWMVHSGGFYEVEKKQLEPAQMPKDLHWFKWQSYTTWMSGICLLAVVYYAGKGFLVDPAVREMHHNVGVCVGLGTLFGGFLVYDLLWRSPLVRVPYLGVALSFALLAGLVLFLTHTLSGRAAYIHVGATLGTVMAGNVFFHIIPSQRELVAATLEGKTQDLKLGKHAKQRSIHNNYITFPVLFTMISNHFPSAYGHKWSWAVLFVGIAAGAGVRHFMNIRFTNPRWGYGLVATIVAAAAAFAFLFKPEETHAATGGAGGHVDFERVQLIVEFRCRPCHSQNPTDDTFRAPPNNVILDTPEQMHQFAERIQNRVVVNRTMPLSNKTGMTERERRVIADWIAAGAPITQPTTAER